MPWHGFVAYTLNQNNLSGKLAIGQIWGQGIPFAL